MLTTRTLPSRPPSLCYSMKRSQSKSDIAKAKAQKVMLVKRTLPHCSQAAFASMVRLAKNTDLTSFPSTHKAYRKLKADSLADTPFGPMVVSLPLIAKPPYANQELKAINPLAYLYTAHSTAGGFFDLMQSQVKSRPSPVEKQWRLVLYSDEVVPGNQLAIRTESVGDIFQLSGAPPTLVQRIRMVSFDRRAFFRLKAHPLRYLTSVRSSHQAFLWRHF